MDFFPGYVIHITCTVNRVEEQPIAKICRQNRTFVPSYAHNIF